MISLIVKGGWVMAPILFGSVVALALVLERLWFFWSIRFDSARFAERVFSLIKKGCFKEAGELCEATRHPLAQIFKTGLEHADEDAAQIERLMEREGNRQIQHVEKNLNYLVLIIGVEPLLGFLGTIVGLIQAFMAWERLSASVTVSALAAGIYQAMLTTAAGLIISIPYFVIYHLFLSKASRVAREWNHYGDELVSFLHASKVGAL